MKKTQFPKGWNEARVQRVLNHYENQTEEEAAAEDDARFSGKQGAVMVIPKRYVSRVLKLINQAEAKPKRRPRKSKAA